jgi:hypothetical protein
MGQRLQVWVAYAEMPRKLLDQINISRISGIQPYRLSGSAIRYPAGYQWVRIIWPEIWCITLWITVTCIRYRTKLFLNSENPFDCNVHTLPVFICAVCVQDAAVHQHGDCVHAALLHVPLVHPVPSQRHRRGSAVPCR